MTVVRSTEIAQAWTDLTGSIPPTDLLTAYYPRIGTAEYETYGPRSLAAAAARHYALAETFSGSPVIELVNLAPSDADYTGNRTIINIVLADTRYTLSSIVSELTGAGHNIRVVRHPILVTERTETSLTIVPPGELSRTTTSTSALPTITPGTSAVTRTKESWIHVEIDQIAEEDFPALRQRLEGTVDYVTAAEEDR